MERLKVQYKSLIAALDTLDLAIHLFDQASENEFLIQLRNPYKEDSDIVTNENITRGLRDSVVQRFEYSVDSLWKYLKDYLETVHAIMPDIKGPRSIIRAAGNARIINEDSVEQAIKMVDCRNKTSHIYKEEIAAEIANQAHEFYKLMREISDKIRP